METYFIRLFTLTENVTEEIFESQISPMFLNDGVSYSYYGDHFTGLLLLCPVTLKFTVSLCLFTVRLFLTVVYFDKEDSEWDMYGSALLLKKKLYGNKPTNLENHGFFSVQHFSGNVSWTL